MKRVSSSIAAVLLMVMLLSAVGCSSETPNVLTTPAPASPTQTPTTGVVPTTSEPGTVPQELLLRVGSTKPFKTTNKFSDYWYGVLSNLTTHDSLIKLGEDMKPAPWLASSWEISPDSQVFTFTIVDNAVWHDGVPLTAEDVKFSVEYYRDLDPQAGWMKEIIQSVSINGSDVTLALTRPYGNLLTEFMTCSIIPRHIWEEIDEPLMYEGGNRVIGSGPFKFESWDAAVGKYVFSANKRYFQGNPTISTLEVEVFRNMDALVMALVRGNIDTWWDYSGEFPYTHIPPLLKSGEIEFASATFLGVPAALGFNLERQPVNDIIFRQAVTNAINYRDIADLVFAGYGTVPTAGYVPPTHPNFNEDIPLMEYNVGKAMQLLDSIGIIDSNGDGLREGTDGRNISLHLLARSDMASLLRVTEMVAANLRAVGIGTTVRAVDSSTWVAAKDAMDYDLVFFRATPWGTMMHASHGSGYFDSRRTGAGVLHNLDAADYLETCDARLSTALAEEQALLDRQLQQLHADYLPGIPLVWIDSMYPYRKGWDNWVIDHIYGGVVNSFSWFTVTGQ